MATPLLWTQTDCLGCHSREGFIINQGFEDVHRAAGFTCMNCHKSNDVHGNGTEHQSMLDAGAIATDCSDSGCHSSLPPTHASFDPVQHGGKIHCTSCHASTNVACYNCHLKARLSLRKKNRKK